MKEPTQYPSPKNSTDTDYYAPIWKNDSHTAMQDSSLSVVVLSLQMVFIVMTISIVL